MKSTIDIELSMPIETPEGEEVKNATLRMLTFKERRELRKKYGSDADTFAFEALKSRLLRLGDMMAPIPAPVFDSIPAPVYDELQEATLAQDMGFDSLEDFRKSERYSNLTGF